MKIKLLGNAIMIEKGYEDLGNILMDLIKKIDALEKRIELSENNLKSKDNFCEKIQNDFNELNMRYVEHVLGGKEPETFEFMWALTYIILGKRVTRKYWGSSTFICIDEDNFYYSWGDKHHELLSYRNYRKNHKYHSILSFEDVTATDWMLYDE
jgi:hypothetical protein